MAECLDLVRARGQDRIYMASDAENVLSPVSCESVIKDEVYGVPRWHEALHEPEQHPPAQDIRLPCAGREDAVEGGMVALSGETRDHQSPGDEGLSGDEEPGQAQQTELVEGRGRQARFSCTVYLQLGLSGVDASHMGLLQTDRTTHHCGIAHSPFTRSSASKPTQFRS